MLDPMIADDQRGVRSMGGRDGTLLISTIAVVAVLGVVALTLGFGPRFGFSEVMLAP